MRRREDRALLTGRGRFVDDVPAAAVITAADLGPIGPVPLMRLAPGTVVPEYPILASDVVRSQGIPVAAVVADSTYAAADGVDRLAVDYEPIEGVADPDSALAAGAPQVVPVSRDNRALAVAWRHGDPDRAFREAAHRVTLPCSSSASAACRWSRA